MSGAGDYMTALTREVSAYLRDMYFPKPDKSVSFKEFQFVYNKWAEKRPEQTRKFAKADTLVKAMESLFPVQCGAPVRVKVDRQAGRYFGIEPNFKKKDALLDEGKNAENNASQYADYGGSEPRQI